MSSSSAASTAPYASEPFNPSTLTLHRRTKKLEELAALRRSCSQAVEALTVDYELDRIRDTIRDKALDEDFSVALRERWQTWSRTAKPFRSDLASSAASELAPASASDTDEESDSAVDDQTEQDQPRSSRCRKRKRAFRAQEIKVKVGNAELGMSEGWDHIRREREARLAGLDAALPSAFRYSERQLQVYAHRLKPKYFNSLDRPFEARDLHRLLRSSHASHVNPKDGSSTTALTGSALSEPYVLTISFFNIIGLDRGLGDTIAQGSNGTTKSASAVDGDRDDYVKRICGDGLGGMKRSETVELLSSQSLADLQGSLFCWSDEQPERHAWQRRLRKYISRSRRQQEQEACSEYEDSSEDDHQDPRFARFTGRRRQTDTLMVIEDKLYGKGFRQGEAAYEADYVTLVEDWRRSTGQAAYTVGWKEQGGDLSLRLDQLKSIRVGQPYWLLHQGDCAHCFVIERIRALRPGEQQSLSEGKRAEVSVERAPTGTVSIPFPRVTWLSTPAMLRFSADNQDEYGLGHRILHLEGNLPYFRAGGGVDAKQAQDVDGNLAQSGGWQIALSRTKRKDEGLLRKKQGKCFACSLRKAQVGILGGDQVRLPPGARSTDGEGFDEDKVAVDGLDDQLVTLCTPCTALLGLPTLSMCSGEDGGASVQLDWQQINREKEPQAGWTIFPLY